MWCCLEMTGPDGQSLSGVAVLRTSLYSHLRRMSVADRPPYRRHRSCLYVRRWIVRDSCTETPAKFTRSFSSSIILLLSTNAE